MLDTKKKLPSFESYGRYGSENYGAHALIFYMPGVDIYFSYKTPVAFKTIKLGVVVRRNEWGPTTEKHLNWIDSGDKASRVDGETFERLLTEALG